MRKVFLTAVLVMASAMWVFAQQSSPSDTGQQSQGSDQTQSQSANQTTVQGCLSKSANGFTLTDKSGTQYQLAGDTSKLSDHVGHEVQIKGKTSESAQNQSGQNPNGVGAAQSSPQTTIDVTSVKHIASTCSSGSGNSNPPSSEKQSVPPQHR